MIVDRLDKEFAFLIESLKELVRTVNADQLYRHVGDTSVGEQILRSAAVIEQTLGGLTANLWDDPFEWTLPEYLSTPAKLKAHLDEVEATRKRAFSSFSDDDCLLKRVAVPSGETRPLIDLLLDTLFNAATFQARAVCVLKILSGISPPGFII